MMSLSFWSTSSDVQARRWLFCDHLETRHGDTPPFPFL